MTGTLICCIDCNKVINMTEWDFCPKYAWHEGEIKEQEGDDRQEFLHRHKGHRTEELILLTPPISDKPYLEPLKISYFEATNNKRHFLLKRWRDKIDDPVEYEIIDGRLEITNGNVRAQTEFIKKQLKAENDSFISEEKLHYFINAIHKEVEKLDPDTLEVSAEGETPLISYYQLGNDCVERILKRCQDKFNQHELKLLRNFIAEHNEYNDVMTLVMEKEFTIKHGARKVEIPGAMHPYPTSNAFKSV